MRYTSCSLLLLLVFIPLGAASVPDQKPVPLPELHTKRLLNDLQVTVAPTPKLGDSMTIGLVVRYGSAFDMADKGGLAKFVSKMFMLATTDKTMKGIQDELTSLGATLEIKADWDGCRFILKGSSSKYERSLLLLYQVVVEAIFIESDFNHIKESILQSVQKITDPRHRIRVQLENVLFGGTTYGRPIDGNYGSVSNIQLGDVRFFHRKFFSPGQSSLMIVGDVPVAEVLQKVSRIWGVWVRNDDVPFSMAAPRNPASRQIFVEDDPDSPAAQFIIGNLFPSREDPAYVNALLTAHIFQERLTKALPTSLLTVGTEGRRMTGPLYIQGQAAAEQTVEELQKIESVANDLKMEVVSQEELEQAQTALLEAFNHDLSTTEGLCNIMLDSELYRLGSVYATFFPAQIRRCDVEAIKQSAQNCIFPGGQIVLIQGPVTVLKPALDLLGGFKDLRESESNIPKTE
jgi:zinc protease